MSSCKAAETIASGEAQRFCSDCQALLQDSQRNDLQARALLSSERTLSSSVFCLDLQKCLLLRFQFAHAEGFVLSVRIFAVAV